jgi:hypothetical protein
MLPVVKSGFALLQSRQERRFAPGLVFSRGRGESGVKGGLQGPESGAVCFPLQPVSGVAEKGHFPLTKKDKRNNQMPPGSACIVCCAEILLFEIG